MATPGGYPETGKLPKLGARSKETVEQRDTGSTKTYRCQWCMVDLEAGVEICPTCGSPGVDTSMIVPGAEPAANPNQVAVASKVDSELEEWWNDDEERIYRNSASVDQDRTAVIIGLLSTVVICIAIGVFVAPILLTSVFESSLGVTVENSNDLRPLGGVLGLLTGAFIGAIGIWVTTPRR
jgi:hypothetical protein